MIIRNPAISVDNDSRGHLTAHDSIQQKKPLLVVIRKRSIIKARFNIAVSNFEWSVYLTAVVSCLVIRNPQGVFEAEGSSWHYATDVATISELKAQSRECRFGMSSYANRDQRCCVHSLIQSRRSAFCHLFAHLHQGGCLHQRYCQSHEHNIYHKCFEQCGCMISLGD